MSFPFQISILGDTLYLHFIFETLAFIVGVRLYYHLKKGIEDPITDLNRLWILFGAMLGALVGSRLLALLEDPTKITEQTWLMIYQNKTVAGGFIGGLFGVELVKKSIGEKTASGDIYVVPIIVALFIGRMGCFSMGVAEPTYGIETTSLLGMNLGDGKLRHPIALYEMGFMILLLLLFSALKNKTMIRGDRFKLFLVLYFMYRFLVEFIKPYHPLFLNLSGMHWSALFMFAYYYKFILRVIRYA
jgi:prolipoprotein diacylglyceryltransferase